MEQSNKVEFAMLLKKHDKLWMYLKDNILQEEYNTSCINLLNNENNESSFAIKEFIEKLVVTCDRLIEDKSYTKGMTYQAYSKIFKN